MSQRLNPESDRSVVISARVDEQTAHDIDALRGELSLSAWLRLAVAHEFDRLLRPRIHGSKTAA